MVEQVSHFSKVGVLIHDEDLPHWLVELIERLSALPLLDLQLILAPGIAVPSDSRLSRYLKSLYFSFIDKRSFERDAISPKKQAKDIEQCELVRVDRLDNLKGGYDLLICVSRLGFEHAQGMQLEYGALWFDEGYQDDVDRALVGFWEALYNQPVKSSLLRFFDARNKVHCVLGGANGYRYPLSLRDTRNISLWKAVNLLYSNTQSILSSTVFAPENVKDESGHLPQDIDVFSAPHTAPTTWPLFQFLVGQGFKKVKAILTSSFFQTRWSLYLSYSDEQSQFADFSAFLPVKGHEGKFWADPFVIERNQESYVLFEEYAAQGVPAHISIGRLDGDSLVDVKPILKKSYHLSYPFVFEVDGTIYMVPESAENESIDLYECTDFPYEWRFKRHLIAGIKAYDATLYYDAEARLWWMFSNVVSIEGASDWEDLNLYYTDDLFEGEWTAHQNNPVVSDVRYARPAGQLFMSKGELIRPSQDSSRRYGGGLNFQRVKVLSPEDYSEELIVSATEPFGKKSVGVHTFNKTDRLTIIDSNLIERKRFS